MLSVIKSILTIEADNFGEALFNLSEEIYPVEMLKRSKGTKKTFNFVILL